MAKRMTWVGMDDSKKELAVAVVRGMSLRDTEESTVLNEDKALKRWVRRLERESWRRRDTDVLRGGSERLCTEAVLRKKLDHAKRIIRVQKKPSEVLGVQLEETDHATDPDRGSLPALSLPR